MKNYSNDILVIAQLSDSHLCADKQALHYGANVYSNIMKTLTHIASNKLIDLVVFTGDLTQDHSEQSYFNFSIAVQNANITVPVIFVAGNHDNEQLLTKYLAETPFSEEKIKEFSSWQIILLNSKSDTPAGYVSDESLSQLANVINKKKQQLIFMHHHPVDVGYFIDRHGLDNKQVFWSEISQHQSIKGIACGHVHQGANLLKHSILNNQNIDVFTCPATSIQFDPQQETVSALSIIPAYRLFNLYSDGTLTTEIIFS